MAASGFAACCTRMQRPQHRARSAERSRARGGDQARQAPGAERACARRRDLACTLPRSTPLAAGPPALCVHTLAGFSPAHL